MAGVAGKVGLVFVSHSAKIAQGLVELAEQMAGDTAMAPAGGTEDGRIGTSFELVQNAIAAVDSGVGVIVLCDLGSAILTAETAFDFLDPDVAERVRIVDAPLVEGAVAAAVTAESGGDLDAVVRAAESANGSAGQQEAVAQPVPGTTADAAQQDSADGYSRTVVVRNKDGLHARPAAEFVKLATTLPAKVTVNGKDAKSLLGIMALGLVKGATVELATEDSTGRESVDALADLIETGFGES